MAQLSNKIRKYLDREVDFRKDVLLQDDGDGVYIKEWNVVETKPTDAQLNALENEATKLENNNQIRATRKNLYGDIGDQLDEIFKNIDDWKARIQKIKNDNPKESS
ncbi:protein XkdW [uncultured Mediterranean phage]|nr:protein XkdW [uncultured Mediterranean phage]